MSKYALGGVAPKKEKTRTYIFNDKTLEAHDDAVRRQATPDAIYVVNTMYSAAMLQALRDSEGFGTERLARVFRKTQSLFDDLMVGRISYYDMAQALRDECGINLIIQKDDGVTVDANDIYRAVSGLPVYRMTIKHNRK